MSSFGETLRNAREAKGLSCSQVAAQTHMLVQIVEEMEREDFHRIPAPIYGRGFVRLFADCVGLDPVPLVREFMDIYEGRRAPTVSIREVPSAPVPPPIKPNWSSPVPEPAVAPIPEPVAVPTPEPAFVPPEPEPVPEPPPVYEPEPASAPPPVQEPEPVAVPEPEISLDYPPESEFAPLPDSEFAPIPESVFEPPSEPEPVSGPEPEPEPVLEPVPEPIPEPPQVTRGLELFEQPPTRTETDDLPLFAARPAPVQKSVPEATAPARTATDPDASPFLTGYDDKPSAAERFKDGISNVSTSILKKVRGIPRRAWRITFLLLCAAGAILFIVWSIGKLYSDTGAPAPKPVETAVPTAPAEQPVPAPSAPAPAPSEL